MEGLIILIIIGVISTLINQKGGRKEKPMPPFGGESQMKKVRQTQKQSNEPKGFTLEDFTKEIFQKFEDGIKEITQPSNEKEKDKNVKETPIEQRANEISFSNNKAHNDKATDKKRSENHRNIPMNQEQSNEQDFVPTSKDALLHAIITSEILGPPVSKRR